MSVSLLVKVTLVGLFVASVLFVHFRGRARLPFLRQLVNHSAWFAPYNSLMYLFSSVPSKPYLDRSRFPELDELKNNWQTIREEALNLFDEGYIRAALNNNEAGFGSFFKKGWKRFYLTWYDGPLPSAQQLCPKTVELVSRIPNVKGAMFTLLPGGSHLNPHRDPFGGSLRYHLGLSTPNSDNCRIYVDGQPYAWRDGEDVMFDETFVHWVKNETEQTRVILFCDIERAAPLPPADPAQSLDQRHSRACDRTAERRRRTRRQHQPGLLGRHSRRQCHRRPGEALQTRLPEGLPNPPPGAGGDPAGHPLSLDLRLIQMPWQPGCHGNFPINNQARSSPLS